MKIILILFHIIPVAIFQDNSSSVVVNLPLGRLQGSHGKSFRGRTFYQFEGVPYGVPPVGPLRFEAPRPVKSWTNTWIADTVYECIQYNGLVRLENGEYQVEGQEDCLYLNIYTHSLDPRKKFDVIVFIHGGAFMFSYGGFYRPDLIMEKDVVYVTINYRLGPLGFLSTENDLVPGNNGFKDQILALKWIQQNIKYFGGNPDSVTITGASAGGVSVHAHILSRLSRGLFHRAICRSGTALNPWGIMEGALEKTKKLAAVVGCDTKNLVQLLVCLKNKPAHQIVHAVRYFQPFLYNPEQPWALTVDTWAQDPVFAEHPYLLLKHGKINDVPVIFSHVNMEGMDPGSDLYDDDILREVDENFNAIMPHVMEYNYTISPQLKEEVGDKIRKFYFEDEAITKANFKTLIKALSERHYLTDIYKTLDLQRQVTKCDIYLYFFTYQGAQSLYPDVTHNEPGWGAGHYEDTPYIFKMAPMDTTTTESDIEVVDLFLQIYSTFAKTGKPSVDHTEWPSLQKNQPKFTAAGLRIDSGTELSVQVLSPDNWQFWQSLPFKENEKLFQINK